MATTATQETTWPLDTTLIEIGSHRDPWTIRDAVEGAQVFGATGAGKSSGSGRALAHAFLGAGMGGLVLTAKPDETEQWVRYCRETGREGSLLVFSPREAYRKYWHPKTGEMLRYNFLDHEARRKGAGAGLTENIVTMFQTVLELAERSQGNHGGDGYWMRSFKQLLRNSVDALLLARRPVSLPNIARMVNTAPQSPDDVRDGGEPEVIGDDGQVRGGRPSWSETSYCMEVLEAGRARLTAEPDTSSRRIDHAQAWEYFLAEFPNLSVKTRSIIVSTFTGMADGFLRGPMRELFSTTTNVYPEATHKGAILVIDLPVKEYGEVGQIAQVLWKYQFQKAAERRAAAGDATRPIFLWVDESQIFATQHDMLFQTTARSSRTCTVYLTQSYSNYQSVLGGANSKAVTDSLLANLSTKIWHANGDGVTNAHASETIGRTWQHRGSVNTSEAPAGGGLFTASSRSTNMGFSESLEYEVDPVAFSRLRMGGPRNDHEVEAIVFKPGKAFASNGGRNWTRHTFRQAAGQG